MKRIGRKTAALLLVVVAAALGAAGYQLHDHVSTAETQKLLEEYSRGGVLIYGAHESAPPLRFVDTDGVYKGVVVDYMNQLSLELGVEIDVVPYPWDEAQEALKRGETDLCDMFINETRKKSYVFTEPIYNLRAVLAVAENSDYEFGDINRMTIATERGDYANSYLQENYPGATLVYVKDVREGVELLSTGAADAVIGDEPVVYYYMNQMDDGFRFRVINTALYEEPVVLGVPKAKAELVPVLNKAIARINRSGMLEKIQQKWFGLSIPLLEDSRSQNAAKWLTAVLLIVITLIVAVQLNNRALKRQVRERTAVLERSQNELQLIFDGILEYIVVLNRDKEIVRANQGLLDFLQLKPEDVTGRECRTLLSGFCGDCDTCIMDECMSAAGVIKRETNYKSEVYEIAAYPLDGIEDGGLVALRNITMDQIRKKQLLQSSKMMAVGQLAAGMAHEMRNPLGIIRTQSYLLRNSAGLDENAKKSLGFIDENVKRAGRIIDNVMNFWRGGSGREEVLNVRESMKSIEALQYEELRKKNVRVGLECDERLTLRCDPEAMKHILLNLLSNAADAVEPGGSIRLSAGWDGERLTLICEDDGCGIQPENMESLFNPFFTTKPPGKGTGLGMFIVYSEVEKLGGSIEVESEPGRGTRFTISIPERGGRTDEADV